MHTLNTWLREQDLNLWPSGYEPDELPDCSIPRPIRPCCVERWDYSKPSYLLQEHSQFICVIVEFFELELALMST